VVKLTKIYTRGGDKGKTSLVGGKRVLKNCARIDAYGSVDEANSVIGIVRLYTKDDKAVDDMLYRIQNDMFDVGSDLANPSEDFSEDGGLLRTTEAQITRLEQEIDQLNADLAPLTSFTLPGGSEGSAYLHLARTVTRRAERYAIAAAEEEAINPTAIKYLNRLSDHLFVLTRHMNQNGAQDVLWIPGANREQK